MRTYSEITDSIFNIEKERAFENLRRGYERQKQELEIRKRDITILTQQKKVQMSLFSAATLAIIATALLVLMKRKSDMYKRLVRNYDSFIMSRNKPEAREESQNSERLRLIYEAMETKMREERIFRNSELNIENAAEAIETNRSYLSKAINTFAGTTFNNYVNSYRIRYAASLLSDPGNTTPIKAIATDAGYNNLQSFYKNFQKETGVPPSKYRQEIKNLKNEQN